MPPGTLLRRAWNLLCSLKLAIVLASVATALIIGGSLLFPAHPRLFGSMDQATIAEWWNALGRLSPTKTWWVPAAGLFILLLGINTLCCFFDWLTRLRARWRKSGEYLIHLGFVLVLAAYFWGSLAGERGQTTLFVGETKAISGQPGRYLRLDSFEPVIGRTGRPMDMIAEVVLLEGDSEIARKKARINAPLTHDGLLILPSSFGRALTGFGPYYRTYAVLTVNHDPGASLAMAGAVAIMAGVLLALFSYYAKRARGDRPEVA